MAKKTIERQKRLTQKRTHRQKRQQGRPRKNMSNAARLYRVIIRHIQAQLPTMLAENQITLTMMITGLLRGRTGQLRAIANAVQYAHKKESLIDRFRRLVRNPNIKVAVA